MKCIENVPTSLHITFCTTLYYRYRISVLSILFLNLNNSFSERNKKCCNKTKSDMLCDIARLEQQVNLAIFASFSFTHSPSLNTERKWRHDILTYIYGNSRSFEKSAYLNCESNPFMNFLRWGSCSQNNEFWNSKIFH